MTDTLEFPEDMIARATRAGVFDPVRFKQLVEEELARDPDKRTLEEMMRDLHSLPGEPMTLEEIQVEVDIVRAERAARKVGR
jgi:hypothetical protein